MRCLSYVHPAPELTSLASMRAPIIFIRRSTHTHMRIKRLQHYNATYVRRRCAYDMAYGIRSVCASSFHECIARSLVRFFVREILENVGKKRHYFTPIRSNSKPSKLTCTVWPIRRVRRSLSSTET